MILKKKKRPDTGKASECGTQMGKYLSDFHPKIIWL